MDEFDAYYEWLGIAPDEQPPNHYRLLGLRLFESNTTAISNAADRQMGHLRTFQTGPHSAESQRLLNETATARVCLLNPEKKATYDEALRGKLAPAESAEGAGVDESAPSVDGVRVRAAIRGRSANRLPALAALVLVLVVAAVGWWNRDRLFPRREAAVRPNRPATSQVNRPGPQSPTRPDPDTVDAPRENRPPAPGTNRRNGGSDRRPTTPSTTSRPDRPTNSRPSEQATRPTDRRPQTSNRHGSRPSPERNGTAARKPNNPFEVPEDAPAADDAKPLPVPSEQTQAKIRDEWTMRSRLSGDRPFESQVRLIEDLRRHAKRQFSLRDKQNEPYVALDEAARLADSTGEWDTMLEIVDEMAEKYEIDPWQEKVKRLGEAADGMGDFARAYPLLFALDRTIKEATALGRYDVAKALTGQGRKVCESVRSARVQATWRGRDKLMHELHERAGQVEDDFRRLKEQPNDEGANLRVGRWYCLVRTDWTKGLPYLAKGSDKRLADLANRELNRPADTSELLKLADAWWVRFTEERPGKKGPADLHELASFRAHVGRCYRRALSGLGRAEERAAEDRIGRLEKMTRRREREEQEYLDRRRKPRQCMIVAMAEGDFEMYVNGELLGQGKARKETGFGARLATGDVITVQVNGWPGSYGFRCGIAGANLSNIASAPAEFWRSYTPRSVARGWHPENLGPVVPVVERRRATQRESKTLVGVPGISPERTSSPFYLLLEVP